MAEEVNVDPIVDPIVDGNEGIVDSTGVIPRSIESTTSPTGAAVSDVTREILLDIQTAFPEASIKARDGVDGDKSVTVLDISLLNHDIEEIADYVQGTIARWGQSIEINLVPSTKTATNVVDENDVLTRAARGLNLLTAYERGSQNMNEFVFTVHGRIAPTISRYLMMLLDVIVVSTLTDSGDTKITLLGQKLNLSTLANCLQDWGLNTDNAVIAEAAAYNSKPIFDEVYVEKRFRDHVKDLRMRDGLTIIHS